MLHLLPHIYTQEIKSEYKRRFLSLTLSVLAVLLMIATIALIPSFIIIHAHKESLIAEEVKAEAKVSLETQTKVEAFEAMLASGKAYTGAGRGISAAALTELLAAKTAGIIFSQITMDVEEGIMLRGIADTRAALTGLVKSLEAAGYDAADIPASTFTLDKNLPFTLSLKNKLP